MRQIRVLFVHGGNSKSFSISPFIADQAKSLVNLGITVDFFPIKGKGIIGYLKNVPRLKRYVKHSKSKFDVIHAHYALSAMVAILSLPRVPVICSYMGNDILGEYDERGKFVWTSLYLVIISLLIQPFLSYAISKSENTGKGVLFTKKQIIPNGVDLSLFFPEKILRNNEKTILFLGNPEDPNKNIKLLYDAIQLISEYDINVITPYPTPHEILPHYFNNADLFVLCSIVEGSPNVVKEAMACNCPIVATNVGNVKWLLGDLSGHFIAKHDAKDMAGKIRQALDYGQRTNGRQRLIDLGLDSITVAKRIERIYQYVLKR